MACYVDKLFCLASKEKQAFKVGKKHNHMWCHMWADTEDELHAMAKKIGMKKEWFQNHGKLPHYDLVPTRRAAAIRYGAIEMSVLEWKRRNKS